jgi:putative lipoprotein (rSAM/lipoprotein system)
MSKPVIKFFDKIIIALLGLTGIVYTSCMYGVSEYGVPHGEYELKGTVIDKETSKPIPNIQIVRERWDTIYSDSNGKYVFNGMLSNFHLTIKDIDGEENGGYFESKEMDVKFTNADQVENGDGHWYTGKFVKTENIELEIKK